jgi:hypothetical protein
VGGTPADLAEAHVDGGQWRPRSTCDQRPVVGADDRHLGGHVHLRLSQGIDDAAGDEIAPAVDRIDIPMFAEKARGCLAAPRLAPISGADVTENAQAVLAQIPGEPGGAAADGVEVGRAGDMGDPATAHVE